MVQSILYNGSFEEWLCAVFDVYEYKYQEVDICTTEKFKGNIFTPAHNVHFDPNKSERVWNGLKKKLSSTALRDIYKAFLSEIEGIENTLLDYVQYAFKSTRSIEYDYSHPAVVAVTQTSKKVRREAHRMEAFVRFQKTKDGIFYATIDPDHNVLPLISDHFAKRYADQQWLIYDVHRKYGIYYNLNGCQTVEINFTEGINTGDTAAVFEEDEDVYQKLWQQYFKSVNIAARKNSRLQLQHVPKRYWKYMMEMNN